MPTARCFRPILKDGEGLNPFEFDVHSKNSLIEYLFGSSGHWQLPQIASIHAGCGGGGVTIVVALACAGGLLSKSR